MADENTQAEKLQSRIDALEKRLNQLQGLERDNAQERIEQLKRELELLESAKQTRQEQIADLNQEINILKDKMTKVNSFVEKSQLQIQINQKIIEQLKLELETKRQLGELSKEEEERIKNEIKTAKQKNEILSKELETNEKIKNTTEKIKLNVDKITGGFAGQILNLLTIDNIFSSIGRMINEVIKSNEQLARTTGQVDLMTRSLFESTASGMMAYGIGYAEMAKSTGDLFVSMSSFSNLNKDMQKQLSENAAKMENLGVSAQTTGKIFDDLTKSLKFNSNEVIGISNKLATTALAIGIAPSKMAAEFANASGKLAAHGKKAIDVFTDLARSSKMLGVEIGDLMGIIGDGFDTFEGAADKAGKLNAILGGDYLNSVEMLNATESERVDILRRSLEASGKNFSSLDRFQQKSIATALGIKDVAQAAKMLGAVSIEDRIASEKQAKAQEELEKAQKQAADSTRQLQLAFSEFLKVIEPVARGIKEFIIFIGDNQKWITPIAGVVLFIGALSKLKDLVGGLIFSVKNIGSIFSISGTQAGAGAAAMGEGIGAAGAAARPAIPIILALGGAIALVGVGVGAAAFGLSYLADSFAKLNADQIMGFNLALVILGVTFAGFVFILASLASSGVAELAAIALLSIGAGIALIGAGIMLAAKGMSLLVDSVKSLVSGPAGANISSVFFELAKGVTVLTLALSGLMLAGMNPLGWIGMAAGIKFFATAVEDIADAINTLPQDVEFKTKVQSLQVVNETIKLASTSGPTLKPTTDFINVAKDYFKAQKDSKDADKDSLVQALKTVLAPKKEMQESTTTDTPIVLKVDGQQLSAILTRQKIATKLG